MQRKLWLFLAASIVLEFLFSKILENFTMSDYTYISVYKAIQLVSVLCLNLFLTHVPLHWRFRIRQINPLFLIIYALLIITATIQDASIFLSVFTAALLTAFAEEILFRGITFNFFLSIWTKNGVTYKATWKAILASSILFSCDHLENLTYQSLSITITQMLWAFGFGCFSAALYFRFNSLIPSVAVHFVVDYSAFPKAGASMLPSFSNFIVVVFQMAILLLFAYLIVRKSPALKEINGKV
ncbi:CPBP family intramembrane glutamic endopeptidase [Lacticaseibacillus saniviri]|nr:CPBP family intramembrane glutamic endopeptidase [Lacticaseibacillus saniviri]MCG4281154.1 CPBP family intramembrane metalloprotease [Lacticaseibacillus saniviri]